MVSNTQTPYNSSNEIDLWSGLKLLGRGIANGFKACLRFIYRNLLWLFLLILCGGAAGFLIGHFSKKYYQSIILMQSKNVNCSLVIREIDALDEYFQQPGHVQTLTQKLSLPEEEVKLIKSISGIYAMDPNRDGYPDYADLSGLSKKNPLDTTTKRMTDFFYIKLELYSKEMPESILVAIKNFIGNNEFCKKENTFHLAQRKAELKEYKYQLSLLDSLEKTDYFKSNNTARKGEQLFLIGDRTRPLFHNEYIELFAKIQKLELDLGLYSNEVVTIMQDTPQPSIIPQNATKDYIRRITLWVLVAGIIVLIIIENRKSIGRIFKETPAA